MRAIVRDERASHRDDDGVYIRGPRFGDAGVGGVVSLTVPKQAIKFPARALVPHPNSSVGT